MCGIASFDDSIEKALFSNFVGLLHDSEADVKVAAINALADYLRPFTGKVITFDSVKIEIDKLNSPIKKLRIVIEKVSTMDNILQDMQNGQNLVKIGIAELVISYANLTTEKMLKEPENSKVLLLLQSFLFGISKYLRDLNNLDDSKKNSEMEVIMYMVEAYYRTLIKIDVNERYKYVDKSGSADGEMDKDLHAITVLGNKFKSWRIDAKILEACVSISLSFQGNAHLKSLFDKTLSKKFLEGFNNQSWTNRMYCVDKLKDMLTAITHIEWVEK